jgi:hypothetical protein
VQGYVLGLIDHAHATASELLDDAVVRDGRSFAGMLWRVAGHVNEFGGGYFSFSYSALPSFRMGMPRCAFPAAESSPVYCAMTDLISGQINI